MIIIIGRGHGGTRAIARTLVESGVYMGELNESYDHVPAAAAYDACRIFGKQQIWPWNFSSFGPPTSEFVAKLTEYLQPILTHPEPKGWKLPENVLMYPWLTQIFPEAFFVHWVRSPLDATLKHHLTDNLEFFSAPHSPRTDLLDVRYQSWLYQEAIVETTPRPKNFQRIWFEDFILKQNQTLKVLEEYLGMQLQKIEVNRKAVGRYL